MKQEFTQTAEIKIAPELTVRLSALSDGKILKVNYEGLEAAKNAAALHRLLRHSIALAGFNPPNEITLSERPREIQFMPDRRGQTLVNAFALSEALVPELTALQAVAHRNGIDKHPERAGVIITNAIASQLRTTEPPASDPLAVPKTDAIPVRILSTALDGMKVTTGIGLNQRGLRQLHLIYEDNTAKKGERNVKHVRPEEFAARVKYMNEQYLPAVFRSMGHELTPVDVQNPNRPIFRNIGDDKSIENKIFPKLQLALKFTATKIAGGKDCSGAMIETVGELCASPAYNWPGVSLKPKPVRRNPIERGKPLEIG